MIKVGVFYPYKEGVKFDMNYYLQKHLPMVKQKVGPALKAISVEHGLSGGMPGAPMTYVAIGHLTFDSVEAFQVAFAPHASRSKDVAPAAFGTPVPPADSALLSRSAPA